MQEQTKRILKLTLGWFFVALGIAGLVLPFLQGFLFLAIGLSILSSESARIRLLRMRLRRRFPQAFAKLDQLKDKATGWSRRVLGRG